MLYDIIVIGAGSAGLNVAIFMNKLNLKVLLIEKHKIGGDCLNYGCVPSKALISLAHIAHGATRAKDLGYKVEGEINLKKIAATIKARQDSIREHENPQYLRKQGIDIQIGSPKFISHNALDINNQQHFAKKIVIATGSRPFIPKIEGSEKVKFMTNETIFANENLPKNFLVIGSGPIGIEIAQAYARLGSKVTVVTQADQILLKEEKEIAAILLGVLKKEGVEFKFAHNPVKFLDQNTMIIKKYDLEHKQNMGNDILIKFDQVLMAVGRKLNIEGLDLEKAGVAIKDNKIVVDKYLRTTNKKIYLCGDVAGGFPFTHWAEYQAAVIIKNMLSPIKRPVDNSKIAWVTYTDPEVATFGLQINQLEKIPHETITVDLKDVDRAICEGITEGKLKLYIHKNKILGGTMIAKNAGELIGELLTAMTLNIPITKLFNRIFPYPTMGRINRKAVQKHLSKKLTPRSIKLLQRLFRILN